MASASGWDVSMVRVRPCNKRLHRQGRRHRVIVLEVDEVCERAADLRHLLHAAGLRAVRVRLERARHNAAHERQELQQVVWRLALGRAVAPVRRRRQSRIVPSLFLQNKWNNMYLTVQSAPLLLSLKFGGNIPNKFIRMHIRVNSFRLIRQSVSALDFLLLD